jgi:hypothetical protein
MDLSKIREMITLDDILRTLAPDAGIQEQSSGGNIYRVLSSYDNILDCILTQSKKSYEETIYFLTHTIINKNINRRKMINMIRNNTVNNELLLFLSGYLDCNIWIYNTINKIFKVYYLEENYQEYKQNMFLVDTGTGYSVVEFTEDIETIRKKYITIPLGLKENKKWQMEYLEMNPLYDDIEVESFTDACPDDPLQYPVFDIPRLLETIKI